MNKTLTFTAVLLASATTAAMAQQPAPSGKPLSIRIGAAFPGGYAAQNNGGKTLLSIGSDYVYSQSPGGGDSHSTVYLDGEFGSKNGGHVDIIGVGTSVRTSSPMGSSTKGFAPYAGAGAGLYRVSIKDVATGNSGSIDGFGAKAFVGVALNGQFFIEGSYLSAPKTVGVNPSGFGLQIGGSF